MGSVGLRTSRDTLSSLWPTGRKPKRRLDQEKGEQPETMRMWVGTEVPKFSGRSHGVARSTSVNEPRGHGAVNERERVAILGIPPLTRPPDPVRRQSRLTDILPPPVHPSILPPAPPPYPPLPTTPPPP